MVRLFFSFGGGHDGNPKNHVSDKVQHRAHTAGRRRGPSSAWTPEWVWRVDSALANPQIRPSTHKMPRSLSLANLHTFSYRWQSQYCNFSMVHSSFSRCHRLCHMWPNVWQTSKWQPIGWISDALMPESCLRQSRATHFSTNRKTKKNKKQFFQRQKLNKDEGLLDTQVAGVLSLNVN